MADIHKAMEVLAREITPRRAAWVVGLPTMREFYVKEFTSRVTETTYVSLSDPAALWDALGTVSMDDKAHTGLVIRGADSLTDEAAPKLSSWATSRRVRNVHALFVSDEQSWPMDGYGKDAPYKHPNLRAVFAHPRKSSILVDAKIADSEIGKEKVHALIRYWLGCNRTEARAIAAQCEYDVEHAYMVCQKAKVLGTAQEAHTRVLAQREAHSGYVEALIRCERAEAAVEAQHVVGSTYGAVIARLDYALDVMGRIHRVQRYRESTHALASRMGVHRAVVARYRGYARHYTSRDVARRTAALVWADEQVKAGRRTGVLEMLAVQW